MKRKVNSQISGKKKKSVHENDYYVAFQKLHSSFRARTDAEWFSVDVKERTATWDRYDEMLEPLRDKYAWAIPDNQALSILEEFSPLIEIGSGKGFWAKLLQDRGVDIKPYDIRGMDSSSCWTKVNKGGPEAINGKDASGRSLFLCYPDEDESIAISCLENFSGQYVIHVGELMVGDGTVGGTPQAPYGRTSSGEFQQSLSSTFHCLLVANLKARLPWSRDCISVWKRTDYVQGRLPLPGLENKNHDKLDGGREIEEEEQDEEEEEEEEEEDDDDDDDELDGESNDSYADFNSSYFADFYEHEKMLADKSRMDFYYSVIKRHAKNKVVLDVGTGTGILAAWASKCGADYVYAIEHNEIVINCAEELASRNNLKNIEFVLGHSKELVFPLEREISDLDSSLIDLKCAAKFGTSGKVDMILHEQMGDCLFDEHLLSNICDLRDRVLKPDGLILPSCYDLFIEPIQINGARHVPHIWSMKDLNGYDYSSLHTEELRNKFQIDTNRGYYHVRSSDPELVDFYLCDPEPVLSIDLHTIQQQDMANEIILEKKILNAGKFDGFAVYFRCREGGDKLETGPKSENRAVHWGFRILRCDSSPVDKNDVCDIRLRVGNWDDINSWFWDYKKRTSTVPMFQPSSEPFVYKPLQTKPCDESSERKKTSSDKIGIRERREQELDLQYAEDDSKRWANVPTNERLPVDRAAPCLEHLLK